ncbi:Uncharacterised protein [Mannheimia haemolytica]|uniref:Uncharacterized protein n=1 Tax=Mannheimia haemolytica TaxID=75985 RepID=A0A448T313_MANHA|nr:YjzC family protein [Mannheimia haemolytica]VEI74356.1 Uncharacterised protein [Mannheimia haemolytica]
MKYISGQTVPKSGIYGLFSHTGKQENRVTCVKGEPFPPTPRSNMYYKLLVAA